MLIPVPPSECMRAREAVSGRLDEELSELEAARLDVHLRRCPACREFAAQAAVVTARLRRAPLEPLQVPVFEPRSRSRVRALRTQAAAAAAVAVAAAGALVIGQLVGGSGGGRTEFVGSAPQAVIASAREDSVLALLPKPRLHSVRGHPVAV